MAIPKYGIPMTIYKIVKIFIFNKKFTDRISNTNPTKIRVSVGKVLGNLKM